MPEEDRIRETSHAEVKGEFVGISVPPMGCPEPDDGYPKEDRMKDTRRGPDDGKPGVNRMMKVPGIEPDEAAYTGPVRSTHLDVGTCL